MATYNINPKASTGEDYGNLLQERIAIGGNIFDFGGSIIRPGGVENGGNDMGAPQGPTYATSPAGYSGPLSSYTPQAPIARTVANYGYSPTVARPAGASNLVQSTFFDTINKGPSVQFPSITLLALAGGAFLFVFLYARSRH